MGNYTPAQNSVSATLRYLRKEASPGEVHAGYSDGTGLHNADFMDIVVPIRDSRCDRHQPSISRNGFELLTDNVKRTLTQGNEIALKSYEEDLRKLIIHTLGASYVLPFQTTWRASNINPASPAHMRAPVTVVHNDYTETQALRKARELYETWNLFPSKTNRPFAIITAWRSAEKTVEAYPLAVCDASTISTNDLVDVERKREQSVHMLQLARYNPLHQWSYFRNMTEEETLLFVCYDSRFASSRANTLHSAFLDGAELNGNYVRKSIETRCLVLFE